MEGLKDKLVAAAAKVIREHLRNARALHDVTTIFTLLDDHDTLIVNMASAVRDAMAETSWEDVQAEVDTKTSFEEISNDLFCWGCKGANGKHKPGCVIETEKKTAGIKNDVEPDNTNNRPG